MEGARWRGAGRLHATSHLRKVHRRVAHGTRWLQGFGEQDVHRSVQALTNFRRHAVGTFGQRDLRVDGKDATQNVACPQ